MSRTIVVAVLAVCAVAVLGTWMRLGTPIDVPPSSVDRISCVSYAPFRDGETPFIEGLVVPEERIEEDLRILSGLTDCVRTYSTTHGIDRVPAVAEKLGMKVMLGIWISGDATFDRQELERGIALANAHPRSVAAVIVGNEVLLRKEQTPEQLGKLIAEVNARVDVPVTYADIWGFWKNAKGLADEVDFVTIHILPYWDEIPVTVDTAMEHVRFVLSEVREAMPGKELMIGETGWPSLGRQRIGVEPSLVNLTTFVREFVSAAAEAGWRYNIIEGFDQPWKRVPEGTVGGYWGLFAADRSEKVTLSGPVTEVPEWRSWYAASIGIGFIAVVLPLVRRKESDSLGWSIRILGGMAVGGALMFLARHIWLSTRTPVEWVLHGLVFTLAAATGYVLVQALAEADSVAGRARFLGRLRYASLFFSAAWALFLIFDPRTREFATQMLVIASVGYILLFLKEGLREVLPRLPEERWLAAVTAAGAVFVVFNEGVMNGSALIWSGTALLLSLPVLLTSGRFAPGR